MLRLEFSACLGSEELALKPAAKLDRTEPLRLETRCAVIVVGGQLNQSNQCDEQLTTNS